MKKNSDELILMTVAIFFLVVVSGMFVIIKYDDNHKYEVDSSRPPATTVHIRTGA